MKPGLTFLTICHENGSFSYSLCMYYRPEMSSRFLDNEAEEECSRSDVKNNPGLWSQDHQNALEEIMEASEFNLNLKPGAIKQMHSAFANIDSKTMGNRVRRMRTAIITKNNITSKMALC